MSLNCFFFFFSSRRRHTRCSRDWSSDVCSSDLGDLLLLVVMHAEIAQESGRFNIDNVLQEISDKLVRRHPHVFGTSDARDSGAVLKQWEAIQHDEEKADSHYLASLHKALPAMMRAQKAQSK